MCPCQVDRQKNKRICKMNRFFHLPLLRGRGRFSSHSGCADSPSSEGAWAGIQTLLGGGGTEAGRREGQQNGGFSLPQSVAPTAPSSEGAEGGSSDTAWWRRDRGVSP